LGRFLVGLIQKIIQLLNGWLDTPNDAVFINEQSDGHFSYR
jgi:hypothetical protein